MCSAKETFAYCDVLKPNHMSPDAWAMITVVSRKFIGAVV